MRLHRRQQELIKTAAYNASAHAPRSAFFRQRRRRNLRLQSRRATGIDGWASFVRIAFAALGSYTGGQKCEADNKQTGEGNSFRTVKGFSILLISLGIA